MIKNILLWFQAVRLRTHSLLWFQAGTIKNTRIAVHQQPGGHVAHGGLGRDGGLAPAVGHPGPASDESRYRLYTGLWPAGLMFFHALSTAILSCLAVLGIS